MPGGPAEIFHDDSSHTAAPIWSESHKQLISDEFRTSHCLSADRESERSLRSPSDSDSAYFPQSVLDFETVANRQKSA
jgi:hypothetical protein